MVGMIDAIRADNKPAEGVLHQKNKRMFDIDKAQKNLLDMVVASVKNTNPLEQTDSAAVSNMYNTLIGFEQAKVQISAAEEMLQVFGRLDNVGAYAGLLGKAVPVHGDNIVMQNGKASVFFELQDGVSAPVIEILNAEGEIVDTHRVEHKQTSFTWNGIPDQEASFYQGMRFRIVDSGGVKGESVARVKGYYSTVDEVIQDMESSGEKKTYLMTASGAKLPLDEVKSLMLAEAPPAVDSDAIAAYIKADSRARLKSLVG